MARAYRERLAGLDGVEVPFSDAEVELSGHFAFPVVVSDGAIRDGVRERLHAEGVQTTFYPALTPAQRVFRSADAGEACPVAEEFADRHLALPLFPGLDDSESSSSSDAGRCAWASRGPGARAARRLEVAVCFNSPSSCRR